MTIEILLWILGVSALPLLGWGIHMTWTLLTIKREVHSLVHMHEDPDKYGFGTRQQNEIIKDNTKAMEALTHYIKWLAKQQTGLEAPPPLDSH